MKNSQAIPVMIVEDEPVTRRGLQLFIQNLSGIDVVGIESNGEDAVHAAGQLMPEVVLMDIGLPGISGIDAATQIKKRCPSARVLMLTSNESPDAIFASFSAGADGYVLKSAFAHSLELAIRTVRCGSVWLDPQIAQSILQLAVASPNASSINIKLSNQEKDKLENLANADCIDGVCLVQPGFVASLKRFHT